jgi:hypothetical protein
MKEEIAEIGDLAKKGKRGAFRRRKKQETLARERRKK